MKDHAFRSHLSQFFKLPVRVTGVDPVLFRQLGEALETVGSESWPVPSVDCRFVPSSILL